MLLNLLFSISMSFGFDIMLTKHNHCYLHDQVNENSMADLKSCLINQHIARGSKTYPVYLVIDSPGGSVYDGLRFISFAKNIPNVHTISIFAASMGSAIVEHLPGRRYGTEHSILMFHRAAGRFSGQFEDGELEEQLRLWKNIVREMERKSASRIGISLEEYKKRAQNEWWLYGSENVEKNTLDIIANVHCSKQLMSETIKRSVNTFLGKIEWVESACPVAN